MSAPRIAFGVLCAKEPAPVVGQLISALGTTHPVFVHHDFRKSPRFTVDRPNVHFLPEPLDTAWGAWELVQAIVATMRAALEHGAFDYFQMLSGTCLPVRPMAEFEAHVRNRRHDVHMDLTRLDTNADVMMSHGYRVFARNPSLRNRVLSRARRWYYANGRFTMQEYGLGIIHQAKAANGRVSLSARVGLGLTHLARRGVLFQHPFGADIQAFIGSQWFGCSREVCEYIVGRSQDEVIESHFRKTKLADEAYFHTVIGNSGFKVGRSNHFINEFVDDHPRWLEADDLERMKKSGAFFARKFRTDLSDPARLHALDTSSAISSKA